MMLKVCFHWFIEAKILSCFQLDEARGIKGIISVKLTSPSVDKYLWFL